ncbi:hypothetical protein UPYG_G00056720 [Umbra pygmaea]|uniref:Ig-like domain-containing protein n=1 Tax=Umbra pygmaea TaxID=75934 RepID=A0ABD0XVT5_UMBPY
MAWVIKLSLLLAVLVRTILTDHVIRTEGGDYVFYIPDDPDYCLFYRTSAEENLLLWNMSNPSPENTLTAEFRGRLTLRKDKYDILFIQINNVIQSDSGQYRMECWRNDRVINQDTRDLLVCSHYNGMKDLYVDQGQTVELQCDKSRDDDTMTAQWYERGEQLPESSVHLNVTMRNRMSYQCALMEEQLCVSHQSFYLYIKRQYVVVSEGEEAVLSCFNQDDPNGTKTWWEYNYNTLKWDPSSLSSTEKQMYVTDGRTTGNYSLVFTSLMLNHTDVYRCWSDINTPFIKEVYNLLVFLKSDLLTEFFSEGEQVVLRCNSNITEYNRVVWFRHTAEGEHVFLDTDYNLLYMDQVLYERINASHPGSFLVFSNLTLKDTGEYWCGLFYRDECVSATKTHLLEWDHSVMNSTFHKV